VQSTRKRKARTSLTTRKNPKKKEEEEEKKKKKKKKKEGVPYSKRVKMVTSLYEALPTQPYCCR
jgi:hypothetical protein